MILIEISNQPGGNLCKKSTQKKRKSERAGKRKIYSHRTAGGYCNNCNSGGNADAGAAAGKGKRKISQLYLEHETGRLRNSAIFFRQLRLGTGL